MTTASIFKKYPDKLSHFTTAKHGQEALWSRGFQPWVNNVWKRGQDRAFLTPLRSNGNYNGYLVTWGEFKPEYPEKVRK